MSAPRPVYVGIDLGTTNSAAAVFDGERVELVRTSQGSVLTPSVVRIDARGRVTVGARARKLFEQDPDNVRGEFKRLMGSEQTLEFPASGLRKKPEELAAEILSSIRQDIVAQFGFSPTRAVISVPALFELPQTAATSEAARLAGFERVEMIQEPVASGLGAGFRADEAAGSYLVYDLGGGTFDASLLESRDGLLRVVGHDGDNFLGGRDFDAAILDHLVDELASQGTRLERSNPEHATALRRLRAAAEDAKIELSHSDEADVFVADLKLGERVVNLETTLTRSLLEQRVEPLIARSLAVCQRLLVEGGLPAHGGLARIILVGGPTKMPLLQRRVAEALGAPFGVGLDPMTLVAEGAAYYAASMGLSALAEAASTSAGPKVWLQYPAMSSDLNPFVVGKLLEPAEAAGITHVVVSRADASWSSPPEPLDPEGTFAVMTSLVPRAANVFRIVGQDVTGGDVRALSPAEFTILHGVTLGDPPLSRTVGVALASSGVRVFFERGCALPARRTFALRTARALSPADPEGALRVPVVQGEFSRASLCRLVGTIEILASALSEPLPANALVEVTIELDRGGRLSASATIPGSSQVFQHVAHLVTGRVPLADVSKRLSELSARLQELRGRAFKHGAHKVVARLASADELLSEGPRLEQSARGADADADEKVQRLLIELDGLLSEAETELGWPDLDERARRTIAQATGVVGQLGTPEERAVLASTLASLQRARAAQNLKDVQRHVATVWQLTRAAEMREEGAWEDSLDYCSTRVTDTRDPKAALGLVEQGRQAMRKGDKPALEQAVRSLWGLMPFTEEGQKHSLGSGVT